MNPEILTPEKIAIIEEIKIHAAIINDLTKQLEIPVKVKKKSRGLTADELAKFDARVRKAMYK